MKPDFREEIMPGVRTNSGRRLNQQWGVNARHALYYKDGTFYERLENFPGALFDPCGYVLFETEEAFLECSQLQIGQKVHAPAGIQSIQGYIEIAVPDDTPEITELKRGLAELQDFAKPRTPEVLKKIRRILKAYERPTRITQYVKRTRGTTCQLCGEIGFVKRDGNRYCEIHHLFHLSDNPPPKCLAPEYIVVLCANCHRRMHYADVGEPVRVRNGWRVRVDERKIVFRT
jgi:5-methylcytosine-specific restriction endonuclease McrA